MEAHNDDSPRILVADDEKVIREILCDFLAMQGFAVQAVCDGEEALAELKRRSYDLLLSDLKMPRMGGIDVLEKINELDLNVLTVIMTGFGTVETAISAMKHGAYDYILKPFKVEEVVRLVRRGLDRQRLQMENIRLKEALSLYKISEAMSQSLSLEHILELLSDTAMEQLKACTVTLLLDDGLGHEGFKERIKRSRSDLEFEPGPIDATAFLDHYRRDVPVLFHGAKAEHFCTATADGMAPVSFCSIPLTFQHRVLGMLNAYSFRLGHKFSEGQRRMLAIMGSRAAASIENARLYENLLQSNQELETANFSLEENFRQTIVGFANALEESDRYTRGHSERVSIYSCFIAEGMGLREHEVDRVVLSAKVHDIGKIGIPTDKLNKAGRLTPEEMRLLREHPEKGKRILEPVPFLRDLVPGTYCHHEAYDGTGYPQGLRGEDIPLLGRIIAVADAYDAMTSDRAYRRALSQEAAIEELRRCAGTQFDKSIVEVFIRELSERRSRSAEELHSTVRAAAIASA